MFIVVLLLLLTLCLFFSFFEEEDNLVLQWSFLGIATLLLGLAAFRPIGIDKDSLTYVSYFFDRTNSDISVEPSFQFIVMVIKALGGSPNLLFVVYAALSIPLFIYAIKRISTTPYLSLAIWVSNFYILQNLTQIRVAVSEAFFLLGLVFLLDKRRWLFVVCALLGLVFHYSALLLLVGLLFSNREIKNKERIALAAIPIVSFAFTLGDINLLDLIPIPYIQERIRAYNEMSSSGTLGAEKVNYLNIPYLLRLTVYYFLLWKQEYISKQVPYLPMMTRIYALSILFYVTLSFLPILASRISELFAIVEVFFIPCIIYGFRPRYAGKLLVNIYAIALFLFNILYQKLLTW